MAIVFNCPHCGEPHRVKDELAGKLGKCKRADCKQQILIPFKTTASANGPAAAAGPVDAETLAAAAFAEEAAAAAAKADAPAVKKIKVTCPGCGHAFEVDTTMQGKNARCPECGIIFRVPKIIEDKPADWRDAQKGKPSLAKTTEPVPEGAWDAQRKGVSGEALRKAGAHEVEDEEDAHDRRVRRIKMTLYGLALLGIVAFAVIYIVRSRQDAKTEKWMEMAIKEIEAAPERLKKPEHKAAIHRYAGEYAVRNVTKRDELDAALKHFAEARAFLQDPSLADATVDRNGMLLELGMAHTVCGGDDKEINEERRQSWDKVRIDIRKTLNNLPANDWELRVRAMRLLARRFADRNHALLVVEVAKQCCNDAEQPEMIGKIGIELFLTGKRDLAEQVLAKAPQSAAPALMALKMALRPDLTAPALKKGAPSRDQRLAYAEGLALQGKIAEAKDVANAASPSPDAIYDKIEALVLVAAVAAETGRANEVGPLLDLANSAIKTELKAQPQPSWLMVRAIETAAKANKIETVHALLDTLKDEGVKSWARLAVLRVVLAGQPKDKKADETWLETIRDPAAASLAAFLAGAEVARHNAAAGESSYVKTVEAMAKGTIRPFGYAGTALGAQDRKQK